MKSQIAVQIEAETHKRLKALAALKGTSLREILETAIEAILVHEDFMRIDEQTLKASAEGEWNRSAALQAEFGSLSTYQAYRLAVAKGLVCELKKPGVRK